MPGRVVPLPTCQSRHVLAELERLNAVAKIEGTHPGKEPAQKGHEAGSSRVCRRIRGFAGEIGQLQDMSVDRNAPEIRQVKRAAGVVEMAVRENNRKRLGARTIAALSRFANLVRLPGQRCVHQHPLALRTVHEINVRNAHGQMTDTARDLQDLCHSEGGGVSIVAEYTCLVRIKTSVTLPRELLDSIDRADPNRSAFLERAARAYLARLQKLAREERDKDIIEANADRLNREAADVLEYQSLP
jgi:hypothetical protein